MSHTREHGGREVRGAWSRAWWVGGWRARRRQRVWRVGEWGGCVVWLRAGWVFLRSAVVLNGRVAREREILSFKTKLRRQPWPTSRQSLTLANTRIPGPSQHPCHRRRWGRDHEGTCVVADRARTRCSLHPYWRPQITGHAAIPFCWEENPCCTLTQLVGARCCFPRAEGTPPPPHAAVLWRSREGGRERERE